jgi:phosphohistidine swiveling domain-containing protein
MNELLYVLNKFLATKASIGKKNTPAPAPEPEPTSQSPEPTPEWLEPGNTIEEPPSAPPVQNHGTVLIAKRSALSSKIIARLLGAMQRDAVLVSTPEDFDHQLHIQTFNAIFTDEEFITENNKTLLAQKRIPVILSSEPENKALFEGLNYKQVDSVLSKNAIASILNTME